MSPSYTTLGKSGLRVSPLCLGTMTFGTEWGWGSPEETAAEIFDHYIGAGGNFVDTADMYTNGKSEELVGKFITRRQLRDRVVLATKFTFNADAQNPNAGGNGRKNILRALEGSLRRLQTDYIDLYWLHAWDMITPEEEVVSTLSSLVQAGKIRHYGLSDVPAWYAARAHTQAALSFREPAIALQLEYSLVERNIEREHLPAASALGMGVCAWSPLASGLLTGRYKRGEPGQGRLETAKNSGNPAFEKFTESNWQILEVLLSVAQRMNRTPAQVALNWVATQPGVTSTIIGATKLSQLTDNLASLDFAIPPDLREELAAASRLPGLHPYVFFTEPIRSMVSGANPVQPWTPSSISGFFPPRP